MSAAEGSGVAPRNDDRLLVVVLGGLTALGPLSIDMYLPSLPALAKDLSTTTETAELTLAAYFAGLGGAQLVYGPLADRFGRKRPLYAGLVLYVVASIACALAPSIGVLIAGRFVQAAGGAAGQVVTRAVVRDRYAGSDAARMLSSLTLVMGVAPIVAPTLGGLFLSHGSWRAIFVALGIAGAASLVLMVALLPETARERTRRLDPAAIARGTLAVLRDPAFLRATLAGGLAQAGMFAYISGSPFVLIELFHVPASRYGLFFGANAAGLILGSRFNHALLAKRDPRAILLAATTTLAVVALALVAYVSLVAPGPRALVGLAVLLFAFVGCLGFVNPNATTLAMGGQGARAGLASGALGLAQLGIAACASSAVSHLGDGTARPMAWVMGACAAGSFALARAVPREPARPTV